MRGQWRVPANTTLNAVVTCGSTSFVTRNDRSVLDFPATTQERIAERPQRDVQDQQPDCAGNQRRIAQPEEACAKPRDHIEEWIGVAHRLGSARQVRE